MRGQCGGRMLATRGGVRGDDDGAAASGDAPLQATGSSRSRRTTPVRLARSPPSPSRSLPSSPASWRPWPCRAAVGDVVGMAERRAPHGDGPGDRHLPLGRGHDSGRRSSRAGSSRRRSRAATRPTSRRASADVASGGPGSRIRPGGRRQPPDALDGPPVYAGIVQEADFNERQASYPLAAAYLAEANNLMRSPSCRLRPRCTAPRSSGSGRPDAGRVTLAVALAVVAWWRSSFALVLAQRLAQSPLPPHVERRPRRPPRSSWSCSGSGPWSPWSTQSSGVSTAMANGSQPVSVVHRRPDPGAPGTGRRRADPPDPRLGPVVPDRLPARRLRSAPARSRQLADGFVRAESAGKSDAAFHSYPALHDRSGTDDTSGDLAER